MPLVAFLTINYARTLALLMIYAKLPPLLRDKVPVFHALLTVKMQTRCQQRPLLASKYQPTPTNNSNLASTKVTPTLFLLTTKVLQESMLMDINKPYQDKRT